MKRILVALILVASFANSAQAVTIWQETFSGAGGTDYDHTPNSVYTTFWSVPNVPATVTISGGKLSLDNVGTGSNGLLWCVDLYAAGLNNGDPIALDAIWSGTAAPSNSWIEGLFWQSASDSTVTAGNAFNEGNKDGLPSPAPQNAISVKHDGFGLPNANWSNVQWSAETGSNVRLSPLSSFVTSQYAWIAIKVGQDGIISSIDNIILTSPVPEPSTFALLGLGAIGMLAIARRRLTRG